MIGIEGRANAPLIEATEGWRGRPTPTLWWRIAERWGPLAPHALVTVTCYAIFALIARGISFGRVQRSTLLYLAIAAAAVIFVVMIAILARALWVALRGVSGLADPAALRTILLATCGAGSACSRCRASSRRMSSATSSTGKPSGSTASTRTPPRPTTCSSTSTSA